MLCFIGQSKKYILSSNNNQMLWGRWFYFLTNNSMYLIQEIVQAEAIYAKSITFVVTKIDKFNNNI